MNSFSGAQNLNVWQVGHGEYGRWHGQKYLEAGIKNLKIIDPDPKHLPNAKNVEVERQTLGDFLKNRTNDDSPDIILVSTSSDQHFPNFRLLVQSKIETALIVLEKPPIVDLGQAGELSGLIDEVRMRGTQVTSVFQRTFGASFVELQSRLKNFQEEYGKISEVDHTIRIKKPNGFNIATAPSRLLDHFGHEIVVVMKILQQVGVLENPPNFTRETMRDSPEKYCIGGRYRGVGFSIGCEFTNDTPSMPITLTFDKNGEESYLSVDLLTGEFKVNEQPQENLPVSDAVETLQNFTNHCIQMALGKARDYLSILEFSTAVRTPLNLVQTDE